MNQDEKNRLTEIYNRIAAFISELEDIADGLDDEDEAEILRTAVEGLEDAIDALDELVGTGRVRIIVTGRNAAELPQKLRTLLRDKRELT